MRSDADRGHFVDRLVERWLYERSSVTLYQLAEQRIGDFEGRLSRFREEERLHAEMLEQLLAELGVAPREQPAYGSATIAASEIATMLELLRSEGLEPRHVVQVLLAAERLDGGGWELLNDLGNEVDLDEEWLRSFRAAARAEAEHTHFLDEQLVRLERDQLFAAAPF
jgi:hypothetical protein